MKHQFLTVLMLGLAARALVFVGLGGYVPPYDPSFYMTLAQHVRDGSGLWIDNHVYGPNLRALFPPLYPLLLALVGPVTAYSVVALNAALDSTTAYLVYRLANRNAVAPAIFLLWPTLVLNSVVAQKESLAMLLVAALVLLSVHWQKERAPLFGFCGGLLALTQPALAPLPAFLALMLLRENWRAVGIAALCGALTLAPWVIRNALVLGEFVPLTTGAGFSLAWVARGGRHIPLSPEILSLPETARATAVGSAALASIASDPVHYLTQVGLNAYQAMALDTFAFQRVGLGGALFVHALHFLLLMLAAIGAVRARDRRVLIAVALTIAVMVWFEFGERHRYFLYPMLMVAAARTVAPSKVSHEPAANAPGRNRQSY